MTGPNSEPLGESTELVNPLLLMDLDAFIEDCQRLSQPSRSSDETPEDVIRNTAQEEIYGRLAKRLIALLKPYRG